ncbi:MAG: DUF4127 family protein [Treponema sp.]|nr:DUF4127 family protein [Treponema sp.]MCL2271845.1 DUF4127 family protein [Treponema sp.]
MKTLLLPLDERPCNYLFPQMIAGSNREIAVIMPEKHILGDMKKPADIGAIENFLIKNAHGCANIVLSVDMLVYGGLIPSRLHYLKMEEALSRLEIIRKIKNTNPKVKIYAFNCIMRTPQYNSSEEEPDYYAEYGHALFRRKYLLDYKTRRGGLDKLQLKELEKIKIPQNIINDYEARRDFNELINIEVVKYLETGIIDFLVIPQDDSSPYGYTAISQKRIIGEIKRKKLDMKVMVYPGADEVALSLLTRAWHDFKNTEPKVFPFYASVLGPSIVPLFEDRPMYESLKSHLRVCRCKPAANAQEADFVLAINCPGKIPQDTYDEEIDISYTSCRNLQDFVYQIRDYLEAGKKVAVCDSAFCNGGDIQLIRYLDELDILDKLISYAGWNTNCNTLGTTLSQACIGENDGLFNLLYRIMDDVCYQAAVRHEVTAIDLPEYRLEDNNIAPALKDIETKIKNKLQKFYKSLCISEKYSIIIKGVYLPWKRMFEIGMELELEKK